MDQQGKKYREPKDTLWGKCLTTFIAIVFAVSTLTIIPIAVAVNGGQNGEPPVVSAADDKKSVEKPAALPTQQIVELEGQVASSDVQGPANEKQAGDTPDSLVPTSDDEEVDDVACNCTGAVHDDDCEAGLVGPVKSKTKDAESTVEEALIAPAAEPEPPAWQLPASEQTITAYSWCTTTSLGKTSFSTKSLQGLGSEEGMSPSSFVPSTAAKDGATSTFHHAQAQSDPQTDKSDDSKKYNSSEAVSALRYNQLNSCWEYKMSDGVWNSMNGKTLVFYYHYNQSIGSDGDVILKSKDWPYTEAEWLAGAGASNPTCAVYQLYDSNGVKLDYQLRTYYYSPNADKLNNSLSIANYWQIEEVRIMPLDGKPAKKQKFDYTAPDNFSQVSGTTADDPNSFTIPWESAWNKSKTACLVAVKVKALPSEQALAVKYINNRTGTVLDTVNITAKKPNGTSSPVWKDYVTITGDRISANESYAIDNGVKVDTNIADKPATISFALNRTGYNPEYVKAEIVKGDGVTAAEVLNLYYDPLSYTVIYADGVEEDEVFADKEVSVYCDDPTPGFGDDPAREGYLFTGWADTDGNAPAATVTGDVTYYAQWEKLHTVTYDLNGGTVADGMQLVYPNLRAGSNTPTVADPTRNEHVFAGWADADGNAPAATVTGDVTYYAQWDEDNIGNLNDPEKKGPDGIADKYQKLVTFAVANGSWNTGSDANVVEVLTFYKSGVLSTDADATATMPAAPAVGEYPDTDFYKGYRSESWHATIPTGDVERSDVLALYTYTYAAAYAVIYVDGANGMVFADQTTDNLLYGANTPAFNGTVPTRAGYVFVGWDKEIADKVTGNVTYTATWDEDVLGNDPDSPGNTDYSDGIADKYQAIVTFAGVGGTVGGRTQLDYVITLKDAAGNNAVDGTYTLTEADVPATAAADGYAGDPAWSAQNPAGVTVGPEGAAFVASWGNGFVAYYYDGALGAATDASVGVGGTIDVEAAPSTTFEGRSYVLDRVDNNNATVVAGDPGQNVVSVYYDLDEVGNDPVNPGSVEHPDGVADKYQLVVSYEAINGTINGIPRVVLDKFDADGNHAVDGTAVLDAGQIPGTAPSVGFGPEGTWAPMAPIADMQLTENTDFVITYAATPVEPTNPDNPNEPTPPVTPPTDPTNPTGPTGPTGPAVEPTPAPGPVAALATPIATATAAAAVEAIADDGNPLAAITALEAIDDDANALAAFEEIHCWTHWLMLFGALVTIVYGLGVLYARRHSARDMDDFEGDIMDGSRRYSARQASDPAANGAFQAM